MNLGAWVLGGVVLAVGGYAIYKIVKSKTPGSSQSYEDMLKSQGWTRDSSGSWSKGPPLTPSWDKSCTETGTCLDGSPVQILGR